MVALGLILTVAYVLGLLLIFNPAELWEFLRGAPFNERGDFLAGVFGPVAFAWLIIGYFLQRKELALQRQELQQSRKAMEQSIAEQRETKRLVERQTTLEQMRLEPDLQIQRPNRVVVPGKNVGLKLVNNGGLAREVICRREGEGSATLVSAGTVEPGGSISFTHPAWTGKSSSIRVTYRTEGNERRMAKFILKVNPDRELKMTREVVANPPPRP